MQRPPGCAHAPVIFSVCAPPCRFVAIAGENIAAVTAAASMIFVADLSIE
jgi:hypothetical protein